MLFKTNINEKIEKFLKKDLIYNLNILGILENSKHAKLYVDNENEPTGVYISDGYFKYLYTESNEFIEQVINQFISKAGVYGFSGIKSDTANKIKSKYPVEWENNCVLYYYDISNHNNIKIKRDIIDIDIKDAKEVNEYYTYRSKGSLYWIKESIMNRPTAAIYNNNELISWLLIHDDNSLGPIYTKAEYRNKGYAIDVTLHMVNKLSHNNKIPFLHVVKDNKPSHRLAKKCGFKEYGTCEWFGIIV